MSKHYREIIALACELVASMQTTGRSLYRDSGAARRLASEANVGTRTRAGMLAFEQLDREVVRQWLNEQGIDAETGLPQKATGRVAIAAHQVNEKRGAVTISAEYQLAAIAPVGPVSLNGQPLQVPGGGYACIPQAAIEATNCAWALTVENLALFLVLRQCTSLTPPPDVATDAPGLLIMRTAPGMPAGMQLAQRLRERDAARHYHAPDVDPAGLGICLTSSLDGVYIPSIGCLDGQPKNPSLYRQQLEQMGSLNEKAVKQFPALRPWVEWLNRVQAGVTQEGAWAHQSDFLWVRNQGSSE